MQANFRLASQLSIIATTTLATSVLAQQAPITQPAVTAGIPAETVYVYGIPDGGYTADKSFSATKTNTRMIDIPQSVSVITRDQIDDQAMNSMNDLVRYVPGVSMAQGEGHRDAPVLRGNVTTADLFVDGVRDDLQYYRDLYALERVEVLKGASGLIFGRSAGGGVINRVMKRADGNRLQSFNISTVSYDGLRASGDLGGAIGEVDALISVVYEDADSYRDHMNIERFGIRPTLGFELGADTRLELSYERFEDKRGVDRGVPSLNGRPVDLGYDAYFGNPELSFSDIEVNSFSARLSHHFSDTLTLTNTTLYGNYDKFYQNVYAGAAITENKAAISAYNSGTERTNLFNQTDLVWDTLLGGHAHKLLAGVELGVQESDNSRIQGQFVNEGNASQQSFSLTDRGRDAAVIFNAVQRDNTSQLNLAALYIQDQISVNDELLLLLGARYDSFDLDYDNHLGADFSRKDNFVSPKAGIIWKPLDKASVYASFSRSYLPQSGDQFASLNATTSEAQPERFQTMEIGGKWELGQELLLTAAIYRIDRERTLSPGPVAGTVVQTGAQRTDGFEVSLTGELAEGWDLIAAYGWQDAVIAETTSAAPKGRRVALVPEHTVSLWNKLTLNQNFALGLGASWQDESYTSYSNAVLLPSFTRVDAALFFNLGDSVAMQLNVENLFNKKYWATAHNDNNIMPGSPTMFRLSLNASF